MVTVIILLQTTFVVLLYHHVIYNVKVVDFTLIAIYMKYMIIIYSNYKFSVKSNELFMEAFSPQKGEGNGVPTNSFGFLIIGGRDLATNEFLNLSENWIISDLKVLKNELIISL